MYNLKKELTIIVIVLIILLFNTATIYASNNNLIQNGTDANILTQENSDSSTTTLINNKQEQMSKIEKFKKDYGSDTYGIVAYILDLVRWWSIPLGIVGIAFCAIYQYVIGLKRLDIRDRGFNTMIAVITIIIICQILPLIFAIVVKSTD